MRLENASRPVLVRVEGETDQIRQFSRWMTEKGHRVTDLRIRNGLAKVFCYLDPDLDVRKFGVAITQRSRD